MARVPCVELKTLVLPVNVRHLEPLPEHKVCLHMNKCKLKGQCPDFAHAQASSVFSSKDNRTVILTRQDFLPDRTADGDLLFIFSSNILDFRRSLSSYIKVWLAVRGLIAILSLAGPPRDQKISLRLL